MLSSKVSFARIPYIFREITVPSLYLLHRRNLFTDSLSPLCIKLDGNKSAIEEFSLFNRYYSERNYLKGSPNWLSLNTNNKYSTYKMETKEELRKRLTSMQYQVTQESATERPFTGKYNKFYEKGVYQCIVCHEDLFTSDTKYDSGCGWPAFNDVLEQGKVTLHKDCSISGNNLLLLLKNPDRVRTEVRCAKCGAHMGHVFDDGPKPTRKRYCINSAAIEFISADELNKGQQPS